MNDMKEFVNRLNSYIKKMKGSGIKFQVINDEIHLRYKYDDNELFDITDDKPKWGTYGITSSIESFFVQEVYPFHKSIHTAIREMSEDFEYSRIMANYLNEAAFNFLKVAHQSNSIEELKLKLQLMGYLND